MDYIEHLRFVAFLSDATLVQLKQQVYRTLRDQDKDPLFESFMNWQRKDNQIMLYTDFCSLGFKLPATFYSIAQIGLPDSTIDANVVIPYSILNGWAPVNKIEKGHRHACLLQFNNNEVPMIVRTLPEVNSKDGIAKHQVMIYNKANIPDTRLIKKITS